MLTRMLMTTVAVLALAAPVAAQDQDKPEVAQKLEQAQQEMQQQEQQAEETADAAAEKAENAADVAAKKTEQAADAAEDEVEAAADVAEEKTEQAADAAEESAEEAANAEEAAEVAEEQTEETPPADLAFLTEQKEAQFLAADEVIGEQVVNSGDEEVGEIADLVMDQDQKLVGVVLSVGGFLGMGEKWVAVPVDSIQFPSDEQPARLLVEVSKEQLENAPDFVTRDTVEAQEAAEEAQMQMQQTAPAAAPATATQ